MEIVRTLLFCDLVIVSDCLFTTNLTEVDSESVLFRRQMCVLSRFVRQLLDFRLPNPKEWVLVPNSLT